MNPNDIKINLFCERPDPQKVVSRLQPLQKEMVLSAGICLDVHPSIDGEAQSGIHIYDLYLQGVVYSYKGHSFLTGTGREVFQLLMEVRDE